MILKRSFDIIFSVIGLILLSPVLLTIAILIKVTMPGPVFFRQRRVGQFGKLFTLIKFRSMSASIEKSTITIEGDRRITKFGAILRKNKLDELPELWNVLMGDMSFVGPRPDVPGYADKLEGEERELLNLKPGITGPASLKYSNEEKILAMHSDPVHYNDTIIYPDKVRINLKYLKNHNLTMDIMIIIHTIFRIKPKRSWIS